MVTCMKQSVFTERYKCYKDGFNGVKGLEYCNGQFGMNEEKFFDCLLHNQTLPVYGQGIPIADQVYMYKYKKNTVDADLEMVTDPTLMPYGNYSLFGVGKTSYNCKAEVESNQQKLYVSSSYQDYDL